MTIQAGTYKAVATSFQLGTSANKGSPQVAVMFQVVGGEHDGERVSWMGYFSETKDKTGKSVATRTIESLQICGWEGDDLSAITLDDLPSEVEIVVQMKPYNGDKEEHQGREFPEVRFVNDPARDVR